MWGKTMIPLLDISIYNLEDWLGVYINGRLEYEGHRISSEDLINLMRKYLPIEEITFSNKWIDEHYENWDQKFRGSFPEYEVNLL